MRVVEKILVPVRSKFSQKISTNFNFALSDVEDIILVPLSRGI